MPRGRPTKSQIRQNIVELLYFMHKAYGYEIYKTYLELFPHCVQKSVYYHLSKGIMTKEFVVNEIRQEKGEYSWGSTVEKIYYELGPKAKPTMPIHIKEYFDKKNKYNLPK